MTQAASIKTIVFDVDGVIASKDHGGDYSRAKPLQHGIECVNSAYSRGYKVVLNTARYGDRENGCLARQYNRGFIQLSDWLEKYKVKYHELWMGKPAGILYVDDKAVRINSNDTMGWKDFWFYLADLEGRDQYGNKVEQPSLKKE